MSVIENRLRLIFSMNNKLSGCRLLLVLSHGIGEDDLNKACSNTACPLFDVSFGSTAQD
jgi:hypothetical protein